MLHSMPQLLDAEGDSDPDGAGGAGGAGAGGAGGALAVASEWGLGNGIINCSLE